MNSVGYCQNNLGHSMCSEGQRGAAGQTKPSFAYLLATSHLMHYKSCLTA